MESTNARPPNLSDLLHRVASTCLTSPCNGHLLLPSPDHDDHPTVPPDHKPKETETPTAPEEEEEEETPKAPGLGLAAAVEVEALMEEVFEAVGGVKRAYARLQEAHCPWDPVEMRAADEAVVSELRRLARLRERYRRGRWTRAAPLPLPLAEAVAPYEAALDEARREVRAKEAELESFKEKLRCGEVAMMRDHAHSHSHSHPGRKKKKNKTTSALPAPPPPPPGTATPELFEVCVSEVKSASKSFVRLLLSIMRASRQDVASAVRVVVDEAMSPHHAKHALSSYLHRKLFQGFEDESFYMDGSLSSLLYPAQHRRNCFSQFRDMRSMDPAELLGVLPSCAFGRWAGKVYLSIVSAEMEGVLCEGGVDTEQRRVVEGGGHPRTGFYGEYLRVAKAVWMLHLLAFALEPAPSQFEASRGSEYEEGLMDSVIRFPGAGGGEPSGWVVGFPVAPGFKLGNGTVVPARVYPIPKRPSH